MNRVLLALMALILVGCGAFGMGTSMPNKAESKIKGNPDVITVNCNGFDGWDKCNEKAAAYCEKGFKVASRDESLIAQRRTMRVTCKK